MTYLYCPGTDSNAKVFFQSDWCDFAMTLPEAFIQRMRSFLGEEADALFAALDQPALVGLRVNTLKIQPSGFIQEQERNWPILSKWEPIPWCPSGFVVHGKVELGKHPFHAAGLYYLQEPSAMAVAEAVAPRAGELVLDLAASPGGKSTHLTSLIQDGGLLVANEIESSRTRSLASNLERWGARRTLICNETPQRLAERWGAIFDRVLVDAPCSGEGMFRKTPSSRKEWSEKIVQGCSIRQQKLIDSAADLVKPGGFLMYSTCTFAPEENEQVIAQFLAHHPDFEVKPITLPGLSSGQPDWLSESAQQNELTQCARLWPHRVPGEGHFLALLQRAECEPPRLRSHNLKEVPKRIRQLWQTFVAESLTTDSAQEALLVEFADQLYAIPPNVPALDKLKMIRAGLWLGTVHRDRFEPSHSLALALRAEDVHISLDFAPSDDRLKRYLQGQTLNDSGEQGWLLVTVSGFPIGWGRRVKGVVKNAYPKGLRWPVG